VTEGGSGNSPKRVLAFGAHPDDIEIYMLGTLLCLKAAGWQVGWIVATDGAAAAGPPDAGLAAVRREEALAAARMFDCDIRFLDYPDGQLKLQTGAAHQIHTILATEKPDLVLVHHLDDYHPDHRALAQIVTDLRPVGTLLLYAEPMLGVGGHARLLVNITEQFETKLSGLACHVSQVPNSEFLHVWNRFRGLQFAQKGVRYAEGFTTGAYLRTGSIVKALASDLELAFV
jgi:N-acetylglucosamine malate deacetylase 1